MGGWVLYRLTNFQKKLRFFSLAIVYLVRGPTACFACFCGENGSFFPTPLLIPYPISPAYESFHNFPTHPLIPTRPIIRVWDSNLPEIKSPLKLKESMKITICKHLQIVKSAKSNACKYRKDWKIHEISCSHKFLRSKKRETAEPWNLISTKINHLEVVNLEFGWLWLKI